MTNHNPEQLRFGIANAYNYWIEIIQPNWIIYGNTPTPRSAFNLAISLWSVIDWIRNDPTRGIQQLHKKEFENEFQRQCPALSIVHDLCTHGKHYTVSSPRGDATVTTNELTGAIFCFTTPFGPVSEQTANFDIVLASGERRPLDQIFREAMDFWYTYFSQPR